jgi:hypothetical protein
LPNEKDLETENVEQKEREELKNPEDDEENESIEDVHELENDLHNNKEMQILKLKFSQQLIKMQEEEPEEKSKG